MIKIDHLSKKYNDNVVLDDISLEIKQGDVVGTGKSTLLRCVNRLETPEKGTVTIGDKVIGLSERKPKELLYLRQNTGMVFQRFNLFPFMTVLEKEELISSYIAKYNTVSYDIPEIMKARGWLDPFEISAVQEEEISFCVQLLQYAVKVFNGDFTRLYGTHWYTSSKSTVNDEMRKFIEHVIDPLIDHIAEHLRHCYDDAVRREEAAKPASTPNFTAHNSTVVIGSQVSGDVSNQVTITETLKADASALITAIKEAVANNDTPNKGDIEEILQQVQTEVDAQKKPKRGLLTALKVLCQAGSVAIPFVTALMELLA